MNGRVGLVLAGFGAFGLGIAVDRVLWHRGATEGGLVVGDEAAPAEDAGVDGFEAGVVGMGRRGDDGERSVRESEERRFHEAIEAATAESIGALVASLRVGATGGNIGDGDGRGFGRLMEAYRRWARLDPSAGLAAALAEGDGRLREAAVHTVFRTMAERDLAGAQAMLAGVENPDLRRTALHAMAESGGLRQPEAFARFLSGLPDGREFPEFFGEWARIDPPAAAAFVGTVEDVAARRRWIEGVASGWTRRDPEGALAWVDGLAGTLDHGPALARWVEHVSRTDPAAAAAVVDRAASGDFRFDLTRRVAEMWARQDMEAALAWAESQPGVGRVAAMESIVGELARRDPAAAAEFVGGLGASGWTRELARGVTEQWAASDREGAVAWALSQADPVLREHALHGATRSWAEQDPASAAAFATSLPEGSAKRDAVRMVAEQWARHDVEGALGWLDGLPPDLRRDGSREVLGRLAHDDPGLAAGYLDALAAGSLGGADDAEWFVDAAGEVAGRWGEFGPLEAAAWASGLPEGEARHRAVGEVAEQWVRVDPVGASEWISGMPAGEARDAAAGRLVGEIARSDPESALRWAQSVGGEEHRADLLDHVFREWEAVDPAAARAARETAGIPAEASRGGRD